MDWLLLCGLFVFIGVVLGFMEMYLQLSSWVERHGGKTKQTEK